MLDTINQSCLPKLSKLQTKTYKSESKKSNIPDRQILTPLYNLK